MDPVIFMIPIFLLNGEPTLLRAFEPIEQNGIEVCEGKRADAVEYLTAAELPEGIEVIAVICGGPDDVKMFFTKFKTHPTMGLPHTPPGVPV